MFNKDTRSDVSGVTDVNIVSLLVTLKIFHIFFL